MGISNKEWLDKRSRNLQKKRNKVKDRRYYGTNINNSSRGADIKEDTYYNINWPEYNVKAPQIFSFIKNSQEVISFFDDILTEIKRQRYKQKFFIDSEDVYDVTIDALVYIIAIINNIKLNRTMLYSYAGNLPLSLEAQKAYCESGFFKYVKSKLPEALCPNSKLQIMSGKITDQNTARLLCLFVMEKLHVDRVFINTLFKSLIEMMSNAVHHAYKDEELMIPCWYVFAEYNGDSVKFVFVDTGFGIANTVKKKFWEKLGINNADSELIYSAFYGGFRTETNLKNRGLGLPALKEYVIDGYFNEFFVLSGQGSLILEKDGAQNKLTKQEYNNKIYGTIYSFEIRARR